MAFLKFLRGLTSKLPVTKTDGNIYFTTDDEKLYIDYKAPNSTVKRACVNEVKNSDLATVAKSGNYSDLSGRPTIPTTLPANGGNADTVDGKHASDFAPVHSHPYDNYSKWTLKANSETTGINITSGTSVDIKGSGTVSVSRSGNVINIAGSAHPTSLPASDVHSWAKASSKPSYSWSEIGSKPSSFTPSSHTHNYAGSSSAGGSATSALTCTGNSATATKLANKRTLNVTRALTGTATSFDGSENIAIPIDSVKESYLSWGGKNFSGSYGCIDAAMISELGANRLAFAKPAGITIEYSRNSGSTWTDYAASDGAKLNLTSVVGGSGFTIGKADSTNKATAAYQLRITFDTSACNIYTALNKFCIYVSTSGSTGSTCTIQAALESTPTTYVKIATDVPISGWSGFNIININGLTTYGNTPSSQYGRLRFIFKCTSGSSTYNGLTIYNIFGFGGVGWTTPSTMAKTGHIYSYDSNQNTTFPANVKASSFIGNLSGNASTATSSTTATVAAKLGRNGSTSSPMIFNWSGKDGQPSWLWGGSDGTNMYVYNPSNFSVNYANSAGNANTIDGKQANEFALSSHSHTKSNITDFPTSLPANGGNSFTVNGFTVNTNVPSGAKFTDTVYTHPTSSGNKHIPSGGSSGQILRWSANGTAVWGSDNNTTYDIVSTTAAGLAPIRDGSTAKFLRADGTWAIPPDTNTNTWRPVVDNLTSTATDQSLSANQGRVLKAAVDSKAPSSHTHTASQISGLPTSLPASDVYSWAKASSKPSYSWSEIGNKPTTFYSHPSTHPASMITQDSARRMVSDTQISNWNNAYNKVKGCTNYDVSGTANEVFILAGGIKVYRLDGWCGNNSSSRTNFPSGLFTKIIGIASSTWVIDALWEQYETTADVKIQHCTTTSVQVLNYGVKPISYQLLIFGL